MVVGKDVKLECRKTGRDSCFGSNTFKWIGGPENDVIAFDDSVSEHSKYAVHKFKNGYTLTIKNVTAVDLNVSYACHCGFYKFEEILRTRLFKKDRKYVMSKI